MYPYVLDMHFEFLNKSFLTSLPKVKKKYMAIWLYCHDLPNLISVLPKLDCTVYVQYTYPIYSKAGKLCLVRNKAT